MLHLVFKASSQKPLLEACLDNLGPDDDLILLDDAICEARQDSPLGPKLKQKIIEGHRVMALQEQLATRGEGTELLPEIELISYADFVQLVATHSHSRSWF